MPSNPGSNMDLSEIMRLAQSPAGQKLLSMLQQSGGQELRGAMEKPLPETPGTLKRPSSLFCPTRRPRRCWNS